MNTAMDDGRPESPGEQTLNFRAISDDTPAEQPPPAFDAFAPRVAPSRASEPAQAHERATKDVPAQNDEPPRPDRPAPNDEHAREDAPREDTDQEGAAPSAEEPAPEPETGHPDLAAAARDDATAPDEPVPGDRTGPEPAPGDHTGQGEPVADDFTDPDEPDPDDDRSPEAPAAPEAPATEVAFSEDGSAAVEDVRAQVESPDDAFSPDEPVAAPNPVTSTEHPAEPMEPVEPVEPAESADRAEPTGEDDHLADVPEPGDRAEPTAPGDSAEPTTPGDRTDALHPDAPAEPPRRRGGEGLPPETVAALTAALDTLRASVSEVRFGLDLPGAEEARQAQADLLTQLQDYVLPRVRTSTAPALIVVAGSTGAGKSTLVNSLAEKNVSRTGVRRPTTGVPVLACHPEDRAWFVEGELLAGLRRIDTPQPDAGLDSMIVVPTEKLPQGVALLDTPDIDSVVEEHHEIAQRMLDAADLWVFVTTAARYADAPAWNLLRLAKERGARLAIVLSRVQPRARDVVLKHFVRMLTEYGLGEIDRFVINEAKVVDGRLPDSEVTDLRLWLAELSVDEERREQAVRETLNGVLNSFRTRVPALAKHLEVQVAFRTELRADVEAAYRNALSETDKAFRGGTLIHGEVLARWQDFAGSGDLLRTLHLRKRGRSAGQAPERVMAFRTALRAGLESVIVAGANRAAEEVAARWRHRSPLGAKLAEDLDRPSDDLVRHASRAIAAWQEHVTEMVRTDGVAKRSVSKLLSFDADSLSLIFMVAMFSGSVEGLQHRLVTALLGAESLRGIGAKALSDLRARIGMLFDEESMRYAHVLDSAGIPDESIATRLYQATYNLEVAR
ncbi:AAA family ATPase [Nonomuraea indica]|uniref:AAA family ATPase n=1 Tax=Nonomuraea indica TaxID=1581193 RepID=A0ABW8AF13_9ACTN